MIRSPRPCVDVLRATLELPVTDDGKANAAVHHVAVVNANVLLDRSSVVVIRMMADGRFVNRVYHPSRLAVAAKAGSALVFDLHRRAALAPVVALENIVVVGQADGWRVFHRMPESPAVHVILSQVVQDRSVGRIANQAKPAMVLVELIAGKIE